MRKLAIAAAVSTSLATFSVNSLALGLGDIEMYSALNQALDAEINILSAAPGELDSAQVRIAPVDAFAQAGLQRSPILSAMKFNIERRADGSPIIKVTSDAPVIEPFLNFLIEVDSGVSGRQIREFTVLLDPPVFTTEQTELAQANVPGSDAIDLDRELGVSSPIDRSDADAASAEPQVFLDEGVLLDLDDQITTSKAQIDSVGFGGAESAVVTIDSIDVVTESSTDPASDDAAGNVNLSAADLLTNTQPDQISESVAAVEGDLIPLDPQLLGAEALIGNRQSDNSVGSNTEQGELLSLDELGGGKPIFDSEGEQSQTSRLVQSADQSRQDNSYEGARVDLTDLIPIELVTESLPANDVVGDVGGNDASTEVDLTGLAITNLADDRPEVIVDAIEVVAVDSDVPGLEDTNSAAATAFFTDADTDALQEGDLIDLSGIVTNGAGGSSATDARIATGDAYRVQAQDTLWSIARVNRPAGVTTQQMVVALLEANPDVFPNGDINQMAVGSLLQMPASSVSSAVGRAAAVALVREQSEFQSNQQTFNSGAEVAEPVMDASAEQESGLSIVGVDDSASSAGTPATDELSSGTDLSRDLDNVNRRVQLAQEELASEAMQRDELQGRVDDLSSSMTKMKRLITLKESELSNLQSGLSDADASSDDEKPQMASSTDGEAASEETQTRIKEMQNKISDEATQAQDRVAARADADKNLAAAEAEAQKIRLSNEEDELRSQLATLRTEKAELEKTAQSEKAALVLAAEQEKTALLAQAQAEQERIEARLEAEKSRITAEADKEKLAIAAAAKEENERLIAEANAERDRLAQESEGMRQQLETLEQEKDRLLAQAEIDKQQLQEREDENLRLQAEAEAEKQRADDQARIRERLAQEQAKAAANLASVEGTPTDTGSDNEAKLMVGSDASGEAKDNDGSVLDSAANAVGSVAEAGSNVAGKGAAAATGALGGLMAYAPLQKTMGDRTNVLATGGGIALLGLLGAWAWRRRSSRVVKEDINIDDRARSARANSHRSGNAQYRDDHRVQDTRPANGRPEKVATTGAATRVAAERVADDSRQQQREEQRQEQRNAASADVAPHHDTGLQDDTLTEAEVYLRYGLHGQAEELLTSAIERDPDNQEYHVKLMENYHDQKNSNGFRAAASEFQDRFGATSHWDKVAQMGRDLDPGDSLYSRATAMDIGSAASGTMAGVAATGAAAAVATMSNDSRADEGSRPEPAENRFETSDELDDLPDDFLTEGAGLDDTIDPGEEFNLSELEATGQFDSDIEPTSLEDVTLDEIDLAALDDDGTLNLEEVAGEEMSGLDLGAMDFGDTDVDSSLDNLTLDDADLNSLDDITLSMGGGLESDSAGDELEAGLSTRVDEMDTMLDLAKAYIDMGDEKSAVAPLKDIATNGSSAQQREAAELLRKISG